MPRWESGIRSLRARISIRVATRSTDTPAFYSPFRRKSIRRSEKEIERKNFRELADRVVKIGSGGNNNKFGLRGHGDRDSAATTIFFEPRVHTSGQENFVNGKCGKTLYVFFERPSLLSVIPTRIGIEAGKDV